MKKKTSEEWAWIEGFAFGAVCAASWIGVYFLGTLSQ